MKKIYILAAATFALASCDNSIDNPLTSNVVTRISASICETDGSRAVDTKWGAGDTIGITTTFQSKVGPSINIKYTTLEGDGTFIGNKIYIYNPMSLTAYYPFRGAEGTAAGTISATTTASKQTPEEQLNFDFLFASLDRIDTDKPDVVLNFAHKMSKITFIFVNGNDGTDVSKINTYIIGKLVLEGTFDTASGVCAAKDDIAAQELTINLPEGSVTHNVALTSLIVFPQDIATMTLKIKDSEEQYYTCDLAIDGGALKGGNHYQYTVMVSKKGLTLQKTNITDWLTTPCQGDAYSADND